MGPRIAVAAAAAVAAVDFGHDAVHVHVEMRLMLKISCDFLHGVMLACVLRRLLREDCLDFFF